MMDKLKSFLLVILIISSLLQSYLLAYSKPNHDPITETQYIETELLGEQREVSQMIFPQQMILHTAEQKHTVLYPNTPFYNMIYNKVKQRTFEGFREITRSMSGWDEIRDKVTGVEIHFKEGIPLTMLKNIMLLEDETLYSTDYINRIWITVTENSEDVRAFFFSVSDLNVYEATRVDLTVRDIEQFVGFGEYLPNYAVQPNGYYTPMESIEFVGYRFSYNRYTLDQLQNSLFVDPGISRKILERDGTEIITDGKRGLQMDREQDWMSYSDPVAVAEFGNDVRENLLAAVQFINRHGGWNGNYVVHHTPANRNQNFIFRQYLNALPIISSPGLNIGYMKIILQKGVVSNYERSLININYDSAEKQFVSLPGGEELDKLIQSYSGFHRISSVIPAYYPVIKEDYIDLIPKWAVELTDGSYDYLH
jgi:regulatory protein YycH of two-component signal transduction system YycFG